MGLIVAAGTLWGLVSLVFLFWALGAPAALPRTAAGLLAAEFAALLTWDYSREACAAEPCGTSTELLHAAAFQDIPVLAAVFLTATLVYARRRATAPARSAPGSRRRA
jgi:hypothetical protein